LYLRNYILELQIQLMVLDLLWHVVRPLGGLTSNINNVTCPLTPSVALPGSQYQETDKTLQWGRRCWKIPHCHHHNQFTSHHLYCPPHRWRWKRKTLALYLPMANFLSRSHENLLRYISYRAVLPFTQLQEVPLGNTPSPDTPRYRLDCPSHLENGRPLPSIFQVLCFHSLNSMSSHGIG